MIDFTILMTSDAGSNFMRFAPVSRFEMCNKSFCLNLSEEADAKHGGEFLGSCV